MAFDALRVVVVFKRMKIYEVLGLGIGCFRELSAGFNYACTFIARNRAVSYMNHNNSPKEALGMFRSRIRRVWGHAAIFAWSDLILIAAASSLACSCPPPGAFVGSVARWPQPRVVLRVVGDQKPSSV